ncbi:MAG TPA: hypothetical protein VF881_06170 [Polyangiaceae bacterium]
MVTAKAIAGNPSLAAGVLAAQLSEIVHDQPLANELLEESLAVGQSAIEPEDAPR